MHAPIRLGLWTTTMLSCFFMPSIARSARNAVLAIARERPEIGKVRAARELRRRGVRLSPSAVHAIWKLHGLATSYERLRFRAGRGQTGTAALSDSQRTLLRRATISRRVIARAGASGDSSGHPRRDELIEVAASVFSAKGYDQASLREICAAAGILPGSMYHHFRSKEDLFVTMHTEGFRRLNETIDRAVGSKSDPWRRLEAAIATHIACLVGSNKVLAVTGTSLFHAAGPALQRRLNRDRAAYEERFREMIAALRLPSDVDRTLLRLNLLGALNWTRVWYRPGKKTPAQLAEHLVNRILRRSL
jgi:AcrR family transcriptional regulator